MVDHCSQDLLEKSALVCSASYALLTLLYNVILAYNMNKRSSTASKKDFDVMLGRHRQSLYLKRNHFFRVCYGILGGGRLGLPQIVVTLFPYDFFSVESFI